MKETGKKKWQELHMGAVILDPGNTVNYKTGSWRSGKKPLWKEDICIQCLTCWISCPDSSFIVKDAKVTGIDYNHCKGCGICVAECPAKPKSLEMVTEEGE